MTGDEYRRVHGEDRVVEFSKEEIARSGMDEGDNFRDRRCIVYARNASYRIAEQLGFRYFVQLDDDYTEFRYRFDSEYRFTTSTPRSGPSGSRVPPNCWATPLTTSNRSKAVVGGADATTSLPGVSQRDEPSRWPNGRRLRRRRRTRSPRPTCARPLIRRVTEPSDEQLHLRHRTPDRLPRPPRFEDV